MIYALEWYDVPKTDPGYLVEYHPYLTKGDLARLEQLNQEHTISNMVTLALTSLIGNRVLQRRKSPMAQKYMQQRWLRTPLALFMGGIATYTFNIVIMRSVYKNDLEDIGMNQYFELDLDADMMRQDLHEMGINVEAKYYTPKRNNEIT